MYKRDSLAHRLHSHESCLLQTQDPDGEHTVAGDKETDGWRVRQTVRKTGTYWGHSLINNAGSAANVSFASNASLAANDSLASNVSFASNATLAANMGKRLEAFLPQVVGVDETGFVV